MRTKTHVKNWLGLCCSLWLVWLFVFSLGVINEKKISSIVWDSTDKQNMPKFLSRQKANLFEISVHELALIDNISLNLSRKIIKFVKLNNPKIFEDLVSISGVGRKTIKKLQDYVVLSPARRIMRNNLKKHICLGRKKNLDKK